MNDKPVSAISPPAKRRIDWSNLNWSVVLGIVGLHLGALAAVWPGFFTWTGLVVMFVMIWVTGGLGVCLCYHRLLTHRSFRSPKWFEYLLTFFGCLAWQGGPVTWVGTHRLHHKHSDEEFDPHSPTHGFTWAHVFWCMHNEPEGDGQRPADAARDLLRDPVLAALDRWFFIPQFALVGLLFGAGELAAWAGLSASGLSWVIWGVCVRTVVVYHGTWFVNSASHTWGYRNFNTKDNSTNLWWVAVLSFGEGWHNNHHAQQRSAAHGMRWFEFDPTYWTIRVLSLMGLAREVVMPREQPGDASEPQADAIEDRESAQGATLPPPVIAPSAGA